MYYKSVASKAVPKAYNAGLCRYKLKGMESIVLDRGTVDGCKQIICFKVHSNF